jgi:hypothetical protein
VDREAYNLANALPGFVTALLLNTTLLDSTVLLNGQPLALGTDDALPDMAPVRFDADLALNASGNLS